MSIRHLLAAALAATGLFAAAGGMGGCFTQNGCETAADCPTKSCVAYSCKEGECRARDRDKGYPYDCSDGRVCDGEGQCALSCTDGERDGDETDLDCGGPYCAPCPVGARCKVGDDCASEVCNASTGKCAKPTCNDEDASGDPLQNGDETDANCGGSCAPCGPGQGCAGAADCSTGSCSAGVCCAFPCAGACRVCDAEVGACLFAAKGMNPEGRCPEGTNGCDGAGRCAVCGNQTPDEEAGETGPDCGGALCEARCAVGQGCAENADCASCNCVPGAPSKGATPLATGTCQSAEDLCDNDYQDLDHCETDRDCGGPCGATCTFGQGCKEKSDCLSGSCVDLHCAEP